MKYLIVILLLSEITAQAMQPAEKSCERIQATVGPEEKITFVHHELAVIGCMLDCMFGQKSSDDPEIISYLKMGPGEKLELLQGKLFALSVDLSLLLTKALEQQNKQEVHSAEILIIQFAQMLMRLGNMVMPFVCLLGAGDALNQTADTINTLYNDCRVLLTALFEQSTQPAYAINVQSIVSIMEQLDKYIKDINIQVIQASMSRINNSSG